jgi:predicted nucleotidyltransferase component of viral defense system
MDYHNYYRKNLYPLQDKFLKFFDKHNQGQFYLTGGTALSRFYEEYRYSEDLDFFSSSELSDFREVMTKILNVFKKAGFLLDLETISDHFFRIFLKETDISLKIDFVNETTFHWGDLKAFPIFSRVDNEMNILANKITCVSRNEAKDIVDIWALSKRLSFSWREIFKTVDKKSPIDPLDVSRIIKTFPREELELIQWAKDVNLDNIYRDIQTIAEDIITGKDNTLKQ